MTIKIESIPGTTQEPLDDEERELMDPSTWDWESAAPGRTVGTPGAVVQVHFSREEILALTRIAREAGIGPVELMRQSALERIAAEAGR